MGLPSSFCFIFVLKLGQFESNRFEIIMATGSEDLVNYTISKDSLFQFGNYYSADRVPGIPR